MQRAARRAARHRQMSRFGASSSPDGAGRPGFRVDRPRSSYSQAPAGRAGRGPAGPDAAATGRLAYSDTDSARAAPAARQRRHRRGLRHRRSGALGRDRRRRGWRGRELPPRAGRGRPRRDAAAATRAAFPERRPPRLWRARIWFCAGIGSSSMRGMRGARTAGRSACGGMNGFSGSASAARPRRPSRPARGTASASARSAGSSRPRSR